MSTAAAARAGPEALAIDNKNCQSVYCPIGVSSCCWLSSGEYGGNGNQCCSTYVLEPRVTGHRRPGICTAFERDILALGTCYHTAGILVGQVHRHGGRICKSESNEMKVEVKEKEKATRQRQIERRAGRQAGGQAGRASNLMSATNSRIKVKIINANGS